MGTREGVDEVTLDTKLSQRGILGAARAMQWHPDGGGWRYPVFSLSGSVVTHRWKNADSAAPAGSKYLWKPTKGCARYYHAPDIRQAVQAAGGVLYIANGEPSVLAYHAAGMRNVLSWYGEASVPASLVDDLRALNVARVIYPPDNDSAGRSSAVKVRDLLAGSGIDFEALSLANDLPDKADFNDLWIACGFSPEQARKSLQRLPALKLPAQSKPAPVVVAASTIVDTPDELIRAVAVRLEIAGFKANGWSRKNIVSPFRDELRPSAGFNVKSGVLHDFTTGQSYGVKVVADRLGIDWRRYYPERQPVLLNPTKRGMPARRDILELVPESDALPDSVIVQICHCFTPGAAMVARLVDELRAVGKLPAMFTRQDILRLVTEAGYPLNYNTFRTSFSHLENVLFQKSQTYEQTDLQYDFFEIVPVDRVIDSVRQAVLTRLIKAAYPASEMAPHLTEVSENMLADALDVNDDTAAIAAQLNRVLPLPERSQERSRGVFQDVVKKYRATVATFDDLRVTRLRLDDLPARARSNPNAYIDALHRARLTAHDGRQLSGRQQAAIIGIHDPRQRSRKLKALGIVRHEVKLAEEIKTIADVPALAKQHRAYPLRLVARNRRGDEDGALSVDNQAAPDFIAKQRSMGHRVYVELQAASRIEVSTPPERQPVERTPVQVAAVPDAAPARELRPDELPGRYTEAWLKFHILRRLQRIPHGYVNPATGEIIADDTWSTLADLVSILTGFRLPERQPAQVQSA